MKIYTTTGDKGNTSLLGGKRIPKYDSQIEAYGTVDELNAHIGLIRDLDIDKHTIQFLINIQNNLFTIASQLASGSAEMTAKLSKIENDDIKSIENEIDRITNQLPELKSFIIPGGHIIVSNTHIARTICRRAERKTLKIAEKIQLDEQIIIYLNRLSDYLFTLARKFSNDLNVPEIPWESRKA